MLERYDLADTNRRRLVNNRLCHSDITNRHPLDDNIDGVIWMRAPWPGGSFGRSSMTEGGCESTSPALP